MKRINNFRSFNVFTMEKQDWDIDYHTHNFYEIIFLERGDGTQRLNEIFFPYAAGDIFFLAPDDAHEFVIKEKTKFIYLKFTEQIFLDVSLQHKKRAWEQSIKPALLNRVLVNGSVIKELGDRDSLFKLANILLAEYGKREDGTNEMSLEIFAAMLTIVERNLPTLQQNQNVTSPERERLEKIISYISAHALDNDKMRIKNIAGHFLMSSNYISAYVKKHTGLSIRQHIMRYKSRAAKSLLQQSSLNVNQIAVKLGFNDASHFNKFYKKYNGITPKLSR